MDEPVAAQTPATPLLPPTLHARSVEVTLVTGELLGFRVDQYILEEKRDNGVHTGILTQVVP